MGHFMIKNELPCGKPRDINGERESKINLQQATGNYQVKSAADFRRYTQIRYDLY